MNKCPKCGHEWRDQKRASGGKARWRGLTKKQRSKAASEAAKARWARTPNPEYEGDEPLSIPVPKGTKGRDTGGRLTTECGIDCAEVAIGNFNGRRIYVHIPLQHLSPA